MKVFPHDKGVLMQHRIIRRKFLERTRQSMGLTIATMLVAACGHGQVIPAPSQPASSRMADPADVRSPHVLAGEWEYEEGGVIVSLVLDEQGNGEYPFKGGRFETGALWDHTWTGKWSQRENDREGGFEVMLAPDYSEGEGRWWYTRIEADRTPRKPGGRFKLIRVKMERESDGRQSSLTRSPAGH
jgi:hypothetical protein